MDQLKLKLKNKLSSILKVAEPGSYIMHENGEYDLRGGYCSLVIADILGLLPDEELTKDMGDLIQRCQTYEGGIACSPYGEAHAGYTYCGLACMILLKETDKLDMDRLTEWATHRQLEIEGGFNGRINKLVDSGYNFWIGATIEMIDMVLEGEGSMKNGEWLSNQLALQGYTLFGGQSSHGGLKDKPGKHVDIYHTMYSLAGLSISQHKSKFKEYEEDDELLILGNSLDNELVRVSPVYSLRKDLVNKAKEYFKSL